MKEGGAHMVKLEGGAAQLDTVRHLTRHAVPVCAHLGLLPQSVYQLGGYRVQGRDAEGARQIREDALALQAAGAQLLVLECVPAELAAEVTASLGIPVIGIGAGPDTDGQVLVIYDVLGLSGGRAPSFVRNFLDGEASVGDALGAYVRAVKDGRFPGPEHSYA
jgi:3-methyl-2-oxobutanoate hydroxymethyltransferase